MPLNGKFTRMIYIIVLISLNNYLKNEIIYLYLFIFLDLKYNTEPTGLLDLPDEIIEDTLMTFLSLKDLYSCNKCGSERLKNCTNRVLHKRTCKLKFNGTCSVSSILYHLFNNIPYDLMIRL